MSLMTVVKNIESTCPCTRSMGCYEIDIYCADPSAYSSTLLWAAAALSTGILLCYMWGKILRTFLASWEQHTREIKQLSEVILNLKDSVDNSTNSLKLATNKLDDILIMIRGRSPVTTPNKHQKRYASPISFTPTSLTFEADEV